ncbi:type II CRISPR RNA-guided endonuclease Cas9 [Sulfurimonas sp.]
MGQNETVFSFDIGWAFHGWAVKFQDNQIDTGVYAFEHDDAYKKLTELKREKQRRKNKNKRLDKLKAMLIDIDMANTPMEIGRLLKKMSHKNKLWKNIMQAHYEMIEPYEFMQILYRFAKRRYYIDMRKKETSQRVNQDKAKEEGDIKKSLSVIQSIYDKYEPKKGEIKTWFSALFERREDLIGQIERHGIKIDKEKFPYTNKKLSKIFAEEQYKKLKKDVKLTGYELLLRNDQVAHSLELIAKKQRELGNNHNIFSKEFMDSYIRLITFKGVQPSLEDKIGLCLSGTGRKRHPKSSIDAEITRIKESYFLRLIETDNKGRIFEDEDGKNNELQLYELGIDYETYYKLVYRLVSSNKKGEVTVKKLLDVIQKEQNELNHRYFVYKNFKHKQDHDNTIVLRLPGHRRLHDLSEKFRNVFLKNHLIRDQIEFEMLCYRDPDILKEKLEKIMKVNKIDYEDNDLEILAVSDVGKPAPCHNETYREIQELLEQGKNFQTALIEKYPEVMINIKREYRKYLSYKYYKKKQRLQGINNPFQDKVIEEFIFLFNRMVQKYGEADRIVLETTRSILSQSEKDEIEKKIRKNEKLNRDIENILDQYVEIHEKKPSKGSRERLKLFVQQGGELKFDGKQARCILTGHPISLEAAIEGDRTNTDHIIPQTWIHDNRLDNKILMDRAVNQKEKEDKTPIQYLVAQGYTVDVAKEKLKENISGIKKSDIDKLIKDKKCTDEKNAKKLLKQDIKSMTLSKVKIRHIFEERGKEKIIKDAEDRIHNMDQRMKGIQDASIKLIMDLLVDQYRFNTEEKLSIAQYREKVLPVTGKMTSIFRRGWLSKYKKRREKYYNHAVDALIMLNFDRAFLTQYIILLKQSYLKDKDPIWIPKEKLFPTIDNFSNKVYAFIKEYEEQSRVTVRRPTKKYTGRIYKQTPQSKNEKHAIKTKKHYFVPNSGFTKLIFYKTVHIKRKKEVEGIGVFKIHPSNNENAIQDNLSIIAEAYRNSLLYIKNHQVCGYYYLVGYSKKSNGQEPIELKYANQDQGKRLPIDVTAVGFRLEVIRKLPINGKLKKPVCDKA